MNNQFLSYIRYGLEFIAFPMFFLLVTHLVGHGTMLLLDHGHDHHHDHHGHGHDHHGGLEGIWETITSTETIIGVIGAIIIMMIWQKTKLKKFIPCNHEHCHTTNWWHLGAVVALCAHFFPEAFLRKELLANDATHTLAQIGFSSHLLIDILVAISISWFFKKNWQKITSFSVIVLAWVAAFFLADSVDHFDINPMANAIIHLISAFLLGMFLHVPHKPQFCQKCTH